jgi:ribosomal protein L15E
MGEKIKAYSVLVGKPAGNRQLGRRSCRWECNDKVDRKEAGLEGVSWRHVAQDGYMWPVVVNTVMGSRVP